MKNLFTVLVITLIIVSCGNDDDNAAVEARIVGTFILTESNSPFIADYNGDGTTSTNLLVEVPCIMNTVTFSNDGTYNLIATNSILVADDNGVATASCEGPYDQNGTYSLNDESLVMINQTTTNPDNEGIFEIDSGTTIVTAEGLSITISDPLFGNFFYFFERQ